MTEVHDMAHSTIVGGSTAKRVMRCPGSVALAAKMPPRPASEHAKEGTLLHDVIAQVLEKDRKPEDMLGVTYDGVELTQDLIDDKIKPALAALDEIDPDGRMEYAVERRVHFGARIPDVFGSCDVLGRVDDRVVVLDWKFGSGVLVEVEDNPQLLFYAAAALHTPDLKWVFEGATEIELVIVQPPFIRRWTTDFARVHHFARELEYAVSLAQKPDAKLESGDHCRWCPAKPVCPQMTGAVERSLQSQIATLNADEIGALLTKADLVEQWISDLRALAMQMLESGAKVPGYKLVQKRGTRQWADEAAAVSFLTDAGVDAYERKVVSPAKAEKLLKTQKKTLPTDMIMSVSSGTTMATEDDPRPAVLQIGSQLRLALAKLQ